LLLRLIQPWSGEITIDGRRLGDIRWMSLRPFLGVALQEAFVLNRSVKENLSFGRPKATEEEMWRALYTADLDATVRETDAGLDTIVGEGGSNLSEGQRQRLSIARAVIGRPRILILDEATSAVDLESESRIFTRLREELPDSTLFVASHRILSLGGADRILVLEDGALVEEGSHRELMEREGFYRRLVVESLPRSEGRK
jgi:ABC-type multidrug transport system fused ATPase/permease subunit